MQAEATLTDSAMSFGMTENQKMIAETVRDFAEKHIKPKMMEWDESQEFPIEVFKKLGELGLMGVLVPVEYGGAGFVVYRLCYCCFGSSAGMRFHRFICSRAQLALYRPYFTIW